MGRELKRILYAEDDSDIRTITAMALEAVGGFSVIGCESGGDAIAAAPDANADLILLDVMMPGMDGLATLAALRGLSQTAETPVIFMTAKVQASEIQRYLQLGAIGVISKPYDPMELSAQIVGIWKKVEG
jgi:two-component system OmpR family response regulator